MRGDFENRAWRPGDPVDADLANADDPSLGGVGKFLDEQIGLASAREDEGVSVIAGAVVRQIGVGRPWPGECFAHRVAVRASPRDAPMRGFLSARQTLEASGELGRQHARAKNDGREGAARCSFNHARGGRVDAIRPPLNRAYQKIERAAKDSIEPIRQAMWLLDRGPCPFADPGRAIR